jgi:hypothetical protein
VNNAGKPVSTHPAMRVDMPESTSFSGNFGVSLDFDPSIFEPEILGVSVQRPEGEIPANVFQAAQKGSFDAGWFPNLQWISSEEERSDAAAALKDLTIAEFRRHHAAGHQLALYRTQAEAMVYDFVEWRQPEAELFLIEEYRLTSHLGDYGTGRIIKTMSLLPGEKTFYQVESYSSTSVREEAASSIFDSMSEESAESFQDAVLSEESSLDKSSASFQASGSVSASASWGWGKAKATGSTSYGTSSSREDFARNVSSAVSTHASRASANRSVEINNTSTVETEDETRELSMREISNPNLSRTLNFIFYQMNQEYITFLHLVDVSVGVLDADGKATIVPLHDLQSLLDLAVKDDRQDEVRGRIKRVLDGIHDYQRKSHGQFVQVETPRADAGAADNKPAPPVYRVAPRYLSAHRLATGQTIEVPGIIVAANSIVLRTDGVYVDALLGRNTALADVGEQAEAARLWHLREGTTEE